MLLFADRADAGRQLAEALAEYANNPDVVVLALPRGGVPVAYEIAPRLHAPLDLYIVRKLGVPGHEELAMGALAGDGTWVIDEDLIDSLHIDDATVDEVIAREADELRRREMVYGEVRPRIDVAGKIVVLVDDGLATGASMRVAATALRAAHPAEIVVAVPVAAARTCASLQRIVDRVVCLQMPEPFHAVGLYYQNFEQTGDDEVRRLLSLASSDQTGRATGT